MLKLRAKGFFKTFKGAVDTQMKIVISNQISLKKRIFCRMLEINQLTVAIDFVFNKTKKLLQFELIVSWLYCFLN